jgi:hypothetical protein
MLSAIYAECLYAECLYAECLYAECHYAECLYAECLYAECCGAVVSPKDAKARNATGLSYDTLFLVFMSYLAWL